MSGFFGCDLPRVYLVTPDDPTNLNAVINLPSPAQEIPDVERVDRELMLYNKTIKYVPLGSRITYGYTFFNVSQAVYANLLKIYHWPYPVLLVPHVDQPLIAYMMRMKKLTPSYPKNRVLYIDVVTVLFESVDVVQVKDYDNMLNVQQGFSNTAGDVRVVTGAELVTNGDFALWTGDDPTSWTVQNEDASNYIDRDGVTNVCQIVSDNSAEIQMLQGNSPPDAGSYYLMTIEITAWTSGQIQVLANNTAYDIPGSVGKYALIILWDVSSGYIIRRKAACNLKFTNFSVKAVSALVALQLTLDEAIYT